MFRFAIDATEEFDVNDLRLAIFSYILSQKEDKKLLVFINNDAKNAENEKYEKEILEILNLFFIPYEKVIYSSDNIKYEQKLAVQLLSQQKAFSCFCSKEKLEELKQIAKQNNTFYKYDGFCSNLNGETVLNCNAPFSIRIKEPQKDIKICDRLKGNINFDHKKIGSFNILNHDKTSTTCYSNSINDMLYDVSHIVQKDYDLTKNAKQNYIKESLSYKKDIEYISFANIKKDDFKSSFSVKQLIEDGFLPSALANYLINISLKKLQEEIFTIEESIQWFEVENILEEESIFNIEELKRVNKEHLKCIDNLRLSKLLGFADEDIGELGKLFLEEVSTIVEIKAKINTIFIQKVEPNEFKSEFLSVKSHLQTSPFFEEFDELMKYISDQTNINEDLILKLLRYILIGQDSEVGPERIYPLIKNYLGEIIK